jgi:multidrug transporter EmrE-like cation transporter
MSCGAGSSCRAARASGPRSGHGVLNNAIPFGLMAWGQQFIETGLTSIFNAATAVFGVLVAAMVFADERLTPRRLVGVTLAFAGVALAIGLDALRAFDIRSAAQLAVLAGALSYAFAAAWARAKLRICGPRSRRRECSRRRAAMLLPLALLIDGVPQVPPRPSPSARSPISRSSGRRWPTCSTTGRGRGGVGQCADRHAPDPARRDRAGRAGAGRTAGARTRLAGFALLALGLVVMNGGLRPRRRQARETPAPPGRSSAR